MNKFHKSLLGMASLLALTAGQKPAEAALPPAEGTSPEKATLEGYPAYADPLFELMKRTNGSFKPQAIESALREMLMNPSPAQLEATPMLLTGLVGLGAPVELVEKSRDVLIELVSNASKIDDELKDTVESKLHEAVPSKFKLASVQKRRRRPAEVGQVGGAPAGASSDIRLKHDIARVGNLGNGLGLYRFSYLGSDQAYIGVMAQEVAAVVPEAIVHGSDGYLRVRYEMLGLRMQTWEEWVASGQNVPVIH
jgi:Chaperone of endosialidase